MIFTIHHAQGTQVGNGVHAKFVQHVVSEDFVRDLFDRMDKHMASQAETNARLVSLLERMTSRA